MAERNLSAKLRMPPSHRSSSFRKLSRDSIDWNEDSLLLQEDSSTTGQGDQSWVVRWRAVAKFDTMSLYWNQRVVIDLGVIDQNGQRVRLLWKRHANGHHGVHWKEPHSGGEPEHHEVAANVPADAHLQWERGLGGVMSLHWKLNLWCPSQYPKLYNPRRWSGSKVPRLPSDYEKGNFNGLDFKPRVEWVVPAAVVRADRAAWRVTVSANLACVRSQKSWFFTTDKYLTHREMQHEEIWRFPGN